MPLVPYARYISATLKQTNPAVVLMDENGKVYKPGSAPVEPTPELLVTVAPLVLIDPITKLPYTLGGGPSPMRSSALFKMMGCAHSGKAFNDTAVSPSNYSGTVKYQVPAPFVAVRIFASNRAAWAVNNLTAIVGVTETADFSTALNLATPVISGVAYPALAGVADVNGWRATTWAQSAAVSFSAGVVAPTLAVSDRVPLVAIPRTDGGSEYLYLQRTHIDGSALVDGTVRGFAYSTSIGSIIRVPTAPMRGRIAQASSSFNDAVASPALTNQTVATITHDAWPIFDFETPVLSVWHGGDSTDQVDGIVADTTSTWVFRACMDLTTPVKPIVFANMAANSNNAATYFDLVKRALATPGVPPPSVLFMSAASINDQPYNPKTTEQEIARAVEGTSICKQYGIPYLVMRSVLPDERHTVEQDNARKAMNTRLKAFCVANNIAFLDFSAIGDGASPEKYVPAYRLGTSPSFHQNDAAVEEVMTVMARSVIANILS